jgi:hypothetical protein
MGRSILTRLRAALLAASFFCVAIVVPDLDAALFHGISQDESRPHVEATGAEGCHAESCVLGAVLPQGQTSGGFKPDLVKLSESWSVPNVGNTTAADRTPHGSLDSRAPPLISIS